MYLLKYIDIWCQIANTKLFRYIFCNYYYYYHFFCLKIISFPLLVFGRRRKQRKYWEQKKKLVTFIEDTNVMLALGKAHKLSGALELYEKIKSDGFIL